MIIDSNLVFTDGPITATSSSELVPLTSFFKPGRMDPIPFALRVTEDFTNLTSLTITLMESDSQEGTYTEVPAATMTIPLAKLKAGAALGWRFLPNTVEKQWLKLAYTVTGTAPTKGRIFAAMLREREAGYVAGMYINGGVVKG